MYQPKYIISNKILKNIGAIEASKEVIESAPLVPTFQKQFQTDAVIKTVHHGTHIEGNDLTYLQTKKVLEGGEVYGRPRDIQEVINYRNVVTLLDELAFKRGGYEPEMLKEIHKLTVDKIVSPEKIIKIYNGLDIDSLNFLPREEARQKLSRFRLNSLWIGCVANFYKTKGLEYLIESARLLNTKYRIPDTKYIVIGEGKERPKLEALIKKHDLENQVILAGRMTDAYRYLKAFDIFVLPSLKEGFPWIILEAIAAQVPIVATKVGALPEIINEQFLAEPKNTEALVKKIGWMLEHPTRTELKPEFTSQKMIKETERVLFS